MAKNRTQGKLTKVCCAGMEMVNKICFLPFWHMQRCIHRTPNLWVFGAWDGVRYSDSSRAFFEYILANYPEIHAVWLTRSEDILKRLQQQGVPVALISSKEGRRFMLHASVFFYVKGALDADPRFLNGVHIVNLWHGMPLKQIGADAMKFIRKENLWKKFKTAVRRVLVPYEFLEGVILSTGPFFRPILSSAFRFTSDKIWELGLPRNDHFFLPKIDPLIAQLDRTFQKPFKILYMPTHRDACTRTGRPFDPFSEVGFDAAALNEVLERNNMVFLYKGHFYDAANHGAGGNGRLRTITDDDYDDQYTFIKDIDLLITDYSSIYFDFLLCRKPILLFPFDEEAYMAQSRPFYFDYRLMEAARVYNWKELVAALQTHNFHAPTDEEVSRFHAHVDGESCRRLMEHLQATLKQ
jgi:CDP-glycerol glycerophosphotransferase